MAVKEIIRMGHPNLRVCAKPIENSELSSSGFTELITAMKETMQKEDGIGIAAPQINISKQVTLIEIPEDSERYPDAPSSTLYTIINPSIEILDQTTQGFWEGCLSLPGLTGFVERPRKIKVTFTNLEGNTEELIAEDFLATVFQHEIDHLNGILYIDHIKDMKLFSFNKEFEEFFIQDPGDDNSN